MSFAQFDLAKVEKDFGITTHYNVSLFGNVLPVPVSESVLKYWEDFQELGGAYFTEKGRAEFLAAPLLADVWKRSKRRVSLLSGVEFNVDPSLGLNGVCDFMFCQSDNLIAVQAPVLVAVEMKREAILDGLGQCAAAMVAAQRFNEKAGKPIDPIYGCVTSGSNWRFLQLTGQQLSIDIVDYFLPQSDRILGILLHCCGVTV